MELKSKYDRLSNIIKLLTEHSLEYQNKMYMMYDHGFISYSFDDNGTSVTWRDIFVDKRYGKDGLSFEYATNFGEYLKEAGISTVFGMVQKNYVHADVSRLAMAKFDMSYYTEDMDTQYYYKEL